MSNEALTRPNNVSVDRDTLPKLLELVEDLGPELVVLQPRLGDRVQDLLRLVEVVVAVVTVGDLELEARLKLGVGDLLKTTV